MRWKSFQRSAVEIRGALSEKETLLLGADLKKDESLLLPAYDGALGISAAFNLNLLVRINRAIAELDNNTYSRNLTALGYTSATALSQEGHWQVSVTATPAAGAATAFSLSAAPAGNHTDPACATITLTSAGVKGSSLDCW